MAKKKKLNEVREPESASRSLKVSTLDQFKEMDREHTRTMSPEERLQYLYRLNENLYGFDLSAQEKKLHSAEIKIRIRS